MRSPAKFVACFLCLLAAASLLSAHEPGLSTTVLEVDEGAIRLAIGISPADLPSLAPAADNAALEHAAPSLWSLAGDRGTLALRETTVTREAESGPVLNLVYDRPPGSQLTLRFTAFDRLPARHRDYFSWMDPSGQVQAAQLMDAEHPSITLALPAKSAGWSATSGRAEQTDQSRTHRRFLVGAAASLAGLLWLLRHRLAQRARRSRSTH